MKTYRKLSLTAAILFLASFVFADAGFDGAFDSLISSIKDSVKDKKVAVAGFKNSDTRSHDSFSILLEDEISNALIKALPAQVIAKNQLDIILGEIAVSADNVFDNAARKQIGRLSSADIILLGNYRINGDDIIVNIQAADLETGTGFASKQVFINKSHVPQYILNSGAIKEKAQNKVKEEAPKDTVKADAAQEVKEESSKEQSKEEVKEEAPKEQLLVVEISAEKNKSTEAVSEAPKGAFKDGLAKGFSAVSKAVIKVLDSIANTFFKAFLGR